MSDNGGLRSGWHRDPLGRYTYRWWNGQSWSDQVHQGSGEAFTDPMGLSPGPAASPGSAGQWPSGPVASPGPGLPVPRDWTALEQPNPQPGYPRDLQAQYPQSPQFPFAQPQYSQPQQSQSQYSQPQYSQSQYPHGQGFQQSLPQQLVVTNATKTPGISVASLVLGIGAFFVSLVPVLGLVCLPFALVGLVLGFSGISRARRGFEGRGMAIAGVVASVLAILVSLVWVLTLFAAADSVPDFDQIDIDRSNGVCDESRYLQDPDC
ncbi:MAG: DUF4190 domain-containing protein [Microthrixaceae bacterium]